MPRIFIGWKFPGDLREEIGRIAESLEGELPAASWVRSETYHLTFAFLGNLDEPLVERIGEAMRNPLRDCSPATICLGEPGFFPSARRPRVGWLGLSDPETVNRIAQTVIEILRREELLCDEKPFRPHLTLVRPRAPWRKRDSERFLSAWRSVQGTPLTVDRVTLFESRLNPQGARHLPRTTVTLGQTSPNVYSS